MTLSVTTDFSAGTAIVASEVNQNFTDVETYINSSPGLLAKTGGTLSGALVIGGDLTVDTTMLKVDASNDVVGIGTATPSSSYKLDISGNTRTTGTTSLIGTVTVGSNGSGHDVTFYSDTADDHFVWDASEEKLTITGESATDTFVVADGRTKLKDRVWCEASQDVTLSGITGSLIVGGDGTGDHLAFDANEIMAKSDGTHASTLHINHEGGTVKFGNETDLTSFVVKGPASFSGEIAAASLDISGDIDVDGTTNLDGVDIDGAVVMASTLTVAGTTTLNGALKVNANDVDAQIDFSNHANTYLNYQDTNKAFGFHNEGTASLGIWKTLGISISNITGGSTGTDLIITGDGFVQKDTSSIRYKNVADVNMADHLTASMVDSLEPKMFSFKADPNNLPIIGLIAEEVDAVSPFLAIHNSDGTVEGTSKNTLITLLIIALKDARTRIAALEG
tara:strand:- start:3510 stop:4859 length:1350 start_codon:yes stop_codon:yes gene_type:complete